MYKYRRVIISVIALLLAAAILTGLLVTVFAANSADIRTEISGLESKQDELDQKKQELEAQIAANNTQTLNVVEQKAQIDQEIELTRQEVENLNEQIRQYNLLIAESRRSLTSSRPIRTTCSTAISSASAPCRSRATCRTGPSSSAQRRSPKCSTAFPWSRRLLRATSVCSRTCARSPRRSSPPRRSWQGEKVSRGEED